MANKSKELTGQKFGRLEAIKVDHKTSRAYWLCKCDCGNTKIVSVSNLLNGATRSCGCLQKESCKCAKRRKHNRYDLSGEYGIGWTTDGKYEFYFDLEDYEKIKDFTWKVIVKNEYGYIVSKQYGNKAIRMHRLVTNADEGKVVDHINHNVRDNRKCNLRVVTQQQNSLNTRPQSNNTSGVAGVTYIKKFGTWKAQLRINGEYKLKKCFKTKEEAVIARKEAEKKYFGEYAFK